MARFSVTVSPGAHRNEVVGRHGDGWKIRVTATAEGGRANEALGRVLAEALGVTREAVRVVSGQTARRKIVEVEGLGEDEAGRRLAAAARD